MPSAETLLVNDEPFELNPFYGRIFVIERCRVCLKSLMLLTVATFLYRCGLPQMFPTAFFV